MGGYAYTKDSKIVDASGHTLAINGDGNLTVHLTDGTNYAEVDSADGLVTIEVEHHQVHEGKMFTIIGRTTDLGSGDSIDLLLNAPDSGTRVHAVTGFTPAGAGYAELWEDATALLAGATLTAYNNDRNSANDTTLVVYSEPDSLTLATASRLQAHQMGGGQQNRFGREQRDHTEWILKQGTDYVVRFISGAASNDVTWEIQYYEV